MPQRPSPARPGQFAGAAGACPECGSRFRIPILEETEKGPEPEQLDIDEPDDGEGQDANASETEESVEELDEEPEESEGSADGEYDMTSDTSTSLPPMAQAPQDMRLGRGQPSPASPFLARPSATIAMLHPLAEILVRLWAAKGETAKVELQLTGGETLSPDRFAKQLSRGSHGVFASKAADGTWSATVIRWDAVERVVLREMKTLPGELAD